MNELNENLRNDLVDSLFKDESFNKISSFNVRPLFIAFSSEDKYSLWFLYKASSL